MKTPYFLLLVLMACFCAAPLQKADAPKKPPAGVPADAKLFNGKWYFVYLETLPWDVAKSKCKELKGQLVVVPDEPTWVFIRDLAKNARVWLGGSDEETQGVWKWIDGTPFTFKAWLPGQPDNAKNGQEHYLHIHYHGWNDASKDGLINDRQRVTGFICEWKDK